LELQRKFHFFFFRRLDLFCAHGKGLVGN